MSERNKNSKDEHLHIVENVFLEHKIKKKQKTKIFEIIYFKHVLQLSANINAQATACFCK